MEALSAALQLPEPDSAVLAASGSKGNQDQPTPPPTSAVGGPPPVTEPQPQAAPSQPPSPAELPLGQHGDYRFFGRMEPIVGDKTIGVERVERVGKWSIAVGDVVSVAPSAGRSYLQPEMIAGALLRHNDGHGWHEQVVLVSPSGHKAYAPVPMSCLSGRIDRRPSAAELAEVRELVRSWQQGVQEKAARAAARESRTYELHDHHPPQRFEEEQRKQQQEKDAAREQRRLKRELQQRKKRKAESKGQAAGAKPQTGQTSPQKRIKSEASPAPTPLASNAVAASAQDQTAPHDQYHELLCEKAKLEKQLLAMQTGNSPGSSSASPTAPAHVASATDARGDFLAGMKFMATMMEQQRQREQEQQQRDQEQQELLQQQQQELASLRAQLLQEHQQKLHAQAELKKTQSAVNSSSTLAELSKLFGSH